MNISNRWDFPDLGLGVGLRPKHYPHIFEHEPQVDWFEIISENYLDTEGRPIYYLDRLAERYPIVMHGVSMSIGSTDPLDFDYLGKLKALAKRVNTQWLGDHLCWTGVNGINGHDLYPLPTNEAVLEHVIKRIKVVQDFLERPIVIENPSSYVTFTDSTLSEEVFIRQMALESGCALLLDVNNVYVSGRNHDFDPFDYLDEVPWEHVVQIHLAGHSDMGTHCIDTHDDHVIDEVWALYAEVHRRVGPRSTLLEWDEDIPDFETLHAEVKKAAAYRIDEGLSA